VRFRRYNALLTPKKRNIGPIQGVFFTLSPFILDRYRGPTRFPATRFPPAYKIGGVSSYRLLGPYTVTVIGVVNLRLCIIIDILRKIR
jgi:hypothetical protein